MSCGHLSDGQCDHCVEARIRAAMDAEREAIARIVEGWHIKKGGYTELAHVVRARGSK